MTCTPTYDITTDLQIAELVERSSAAVAALDELGRILWASPAIRVAVAKSRDLADRPAFFDFLHPDDLLEARAAYERNLVAPGRGERFRARFRTHELDRWHWVELDTNNQLDNPEVRAVVATMRGIDSQTDMETALRESELRLRAVVESAPVIIVAYDTAGIITLADGQGFRTLPESSSGLVGTPMSVFFDDFPFLEEGMDAVLRGERHYTTLEFGETILEMHSSPIVQEGIITGGIAIGTDVTDRNQAHEELVRREEQFRSLVHRSSDIAMVFDQEGTILYSSPAVRLFGYEPADLLGTSSYDLCHPDDVAEARRSVPELLREAGSTITREIRVRDAFGQHRWVEEVLTNRLDDPAIGGVVGNIRDITDRKESEFELASRATTDHLTGLTNRAEFGSRLEATLSRASSSGGAATVAFLDLDDFKLVNDSFGHAAGDRLLRQVAARLQGAVRSDDVVARFGGDEFVVLCEGGGDLAAGRLGQRLDEVFDAPFDVGGERLRISASIGIATTPPCHADTLLRHADAAMYRAKERGRDRVEIFDASFQERTTSVLRLRNEMRLGLERDEFVLHYQPIVDLTTEAIVGMEALVRWVHPDRGVVPPLEFIPEAEESGFIVPLGAWVIRTACDQAASLPRGMYVTVNVSVRQLADDRIVDTVRRSLALSGLEPEALILEVTESTLMANAERTLGVLNELRDLGVRLAIDDFGTGYSSLLYLKRMPVDTLKVDRSFVDGLGEDAEDSAIVASVVSLANAVGIGTVAEGVENQEQRRQLIELGCKLGQGFLWSRAVPADEFEALIAAGDRHADETGPLRSVQGVSGPTQRSSR